MANPYEGILNTTTSLTSPSLSPQPSDAPPPLDPQNKYGGAVHDLAVDRRRNAVNAIRGSLNLSPDHAASAKQLARQLKVHAKPFMTGDLSQIELKNQSIVKNAHSILKQHPKLQTFLADPENAAITYDDLSNLQLIAQKMDLLIQGQKAEGFSGWASNTKDLTVAQFKRVPTNTAQWALEAVAGATAFSRFMQNMSPEEREEWRSKTPSEQAQERSKIENAKNEGVVPLLDTVRGINRKYAEELEFLTARAPEGAAGLASKIITGTIQMLPSALVTVITKNPKYGAALMTTQILGPEYVRQRDKGATRQDAFAGAAFFGILEQVTEKIPLGKLLEEGPGFIKGILKAAGAEGIQEGAVETVRLAYDYGVFNDKTSAVDAFSQILEASVVGAGVGANLRLTVRGPIDAWTALRNDPKATDFADRTTALRDAVDQAKVTARDPATMREALLAMEDADGEATVFVSAEEVIELEQSGTLTSLDVAVLAPGQDALDAAQRGGDIEIRVADLMMAEREKFDVLSQHVRQSVGAASAREAQEQLTEREEVIASLLAQMEQQKEADPEIRPVAAAVTEALKSTGLYSDAAIEQQAELAEATYQKRAERLEGVTAESLFLEDNVKIRGPKDRTRSPAIASFEQVDRIKLNYKDVTERTPALNEAARRRRAGEITAEEYAREVDKLKTVLPFEAVPEPATTEEMRGALDKRKKEKLGKADQIPVGQRVGLRLDIPAYRDHGVWVPTIHNTPVGNVHEAAAQITNVDLMPTEGEQQKAAQVFDDPDRTKKSPFARMDGDFQSADVEALAARAQDVINDPEWTQVGYDPERHSFFYDRSDQRPIVSAEEVIQVGPLVLAKNAQYGDAETFLFQDASLVKQADASLDLASAEKEVVASIENANGEVIEFTQVDALMDLEQVSVLTLDDLVGMKIFPTIADRTAAAALYTGIDGAELDIAIPMLGGPFFPLRMSNWENNAIWANRGASVNTAKENKITEEGATHMLVLLGDPNMHVSNTTVSTAYFKTVFAALSNPDNSFTSTKAAALTELLQQWNLNRPLVEPKREDFKEGPEEDAKHAKARKNYTENVILRRDVNGFPDFNNAPAVVDYLHKISFEARKTIMKIMGSKKAEALTNINMQKLLNETREQSLSGHGWGDGVLLLEVDREDTFVKLGEDGTTRHPDYPLGIRGRVAGRFETPIGWQTLWSEYAEANSDKDNIRRAFELSRPVVEVTQEQVDKINAAGGIDAPGVQTRTHASMVVDGVEGNWKRGNVSKKDGGLGAAEFMDAMDIAVSGMINKIREVRGTSEGLTAAIKNGVVEISQLGEHHVYYGTEVIDGEKTLVALVNNDSGTEGIGESLAILDAIQSGVAVAVAEEGSLEYTLLNDFGFEPDGDVLRWRGNSNVRESVTKNYFKDSFSDVLGGRSTEYVEELEGGPSSEDRVDAEGRPQVRPEEIERDESVLREDDAASRARALAQQLATLSPAARENLGVTEQDQSNIQALLAEEVSLEQRPGEVTRGLYRQERETYGDLSNVIILTEDADRTTFLHELGHFWLYQMHNDIRDPRLTKEGKRELEQMMSSTKTWFRKNYTDAWRDIQKIAKSAAQRAKANPDNPSFRNKAEALASAIAHAKKNGGVKYMQGVADNFMSGTVEYGTELEVAFHELWARGTEQYLGEGRAPTTGLRKAFSQFAVWVGRTYGALTNLNVSIDPSIRDVFDRVLATENAIQEERNRTLYKIPDEVTSELTDAERAELERSVQEAENEARQQMIEKVAKDIRRERGAEYKEEEQRVTADVTKELDSQPLYKVLDILRTGSEWNDGPIGLNREEFIAVFGKETARKMPPNSFAKKGQPQLDLTLMSTAAGYSSQEEMVAELTSGFMSKQEAVKAETDARMQEQFGELIDADQLTDAAEDVVQNEKTVELMALQARIVRRLARASLEKQAQRKAEQEGAPTAAEDREAIGDIEAMSGFAPTVEDAVPEQLRDAASRVQHRANVSQRRAQAAAVQSVRSITRAMDTKAIKEAALRFVQRLPAGKLTPARFRQTADRQARKAQIAIAKRNYTEAADLLQQRALNIAIAREVQAKAELMERQLNTVRKVLRKSDEKLKNTHDTDIVGVLRAIMDEWGVAKVSSTAVDLQTIVDNVTEDKAAELKELMRGMLDDLPVYRQKSEGKPAYKQLPFVEFSSLMQQTISLLTNARADRSMQIEGQRIAFETIAEEVEQQTADISLKLGKRTNMGSRARRWVVGGSRTMKSYITRVELWARAMDGGDAGPLQKYLVDPVMAAVTRYDTGRLPVLKGLMDRIISTDETYNKPVHIEAPELDGYTFRTKGELLHFILHMGNASNRRKLLLGAADLSQVGGKKFKWTDSIAKDDSVDTSRANAFLNRMFDEGVITKQDMDLAQTIWDTFEETKGAAQQAHRSMHGRYFSEVEAEIFSTPFGNYKGGYVPAVTDNLQNPDGPVRDAEAALDGAQNAAMFPGAEDGFTKGRVDYNQPLLLDLATIPMHLDRVLRFSYLGPAVRSAARLVNNKRFKAAIGKFDNTTIPEAIIPWLQRTSRQSLSEPGNPSVDKFWTALNKRVGLQTMTGNIVNAAQQVTGIPTAAVRVKVRYLMKNLARFRKDGESARKYIEERSPYMATRFRNSVNETMANMNSLLTEEGLLSNAQRAADKYGYFAQQMTQNLIDPVVWLAAEEQFHSTGLWEQTYNEYSSLGHDVAEVKADAAAALYADKIIRATQAPMGPQEVSRIETGSAFIRLFMKFYTYFNSMANLNLSEFKVIARDIGFKGNKPGRFFFLYLMGIAVPSIVAEGLTMAARGDFDDLDDKEDEEIIRTFADLFVTSQAKYVAYWVPGAGALVNWAIGQTNEVFYDDRLSMSPVLSISESVMTGVSRLIKDGVNVLTGEETRDASRMVGDALNAIGVTLGLPTGWFRKPVQYFLKVEEGTADPENVGDWVQGFISGRDGTED
tara:strand:- start:3186 stop:12053 length:8868 start_codon:yes stop_codon:yes gene_type:complete